MLEGVSMDAVLHNRRVWDRLVAEGNEWTVPLSPEQVAAARSGHWDGLLYLTPSRPVPREWLPCPLKGQRVLCLACGGGQQAPLLAAAGAEVTVVDISAAQLEQDRKVAEREALPLRLIQGDMRDLSMLDDAGFDTVLNPVSVSYLPEVHSFFRECFRVLRPGGRLLFAAPYPYIYIFHGGDWDRGKLRVTNRLPFSSLDEWDGTDKSLDDRHPVEFSHTMEALLGGQLAAGFHLTGFYEDREKKAKKDPLSPFCAKYFATLAFRS